MGPSAVGQPNPTSGGMMVAPQQGRAGGPTGPGQMPPTSQAMNKAPSAIKTNIKSATQMHPYGR